MPSVLQINSCANWGSTGKIAERIGRIREIKPDIIHLHNIHGYSIDIG